MILSTSATSRINWCVDNVEDWVSGGDVAACSSETTHAGAVSLLVFCVKPLLSGILHSEVTRDATCQMIRVHRKKKKKLACEK